jgi:hypothetical protein
MSVARIFKTENRLAKIARRPGGKSIEEAVRTAEMRIESVRDRCVASLADKAEHLATLAAGDRTTASDEMLGGLYNTSNAIFGVAGVYGLDALAEAACSLCDLLYRFRSGEPVNWQAVDVHVDGIRLLAGGSTEGATSILAGLKRVRARFLAD